MNILDKLRITKQSIYLNLNRDGDKHYHSWKLWSNCIWTTYSRMLKALISNILFLEKLYTELSPTENEYLRLLKDITTIEKATGLNWEQIKEKLG